MFLLQEPVSEWKSDWRKEQERRRAEEMGKRVFVSAPQIRERQKKAKRTVPAELRIRRPKGEAIGNKEYMRNLRQSNRAQGLCGSCGEPAVHGRYSCTTCLERKARYYCKRKNKEYVPRAVLIKFCKTCNTLLNANNVYGFCNVHYQQKRRSKAFKLARAA